MQLKDGEVNKSDQKVLLNRSPERIHNYSELQAAVRFFMTKRVQQSTTTQPGSPVAAIDAIHSRPSANAAKLYDAGGLYPTVSLLIAEAAHVHVMLTANIWQEVCLHNGAAGAVCRLIYREGLPPPNLPIDVLVKFTGPLFYCFTRKSQMCTSCANDF